MKNLRIAAALVLVLASFVCSVFAISKQEAAKARQKCLDSYHYCEDVTCGHGGYTGNALLNCQAFCLAQFNKCLDRVGLTPDGTPPDRIGRPNPTPTPDRHRGVGQANPTGKSNSSTPSATPSPPKFLKATPSPTPKKHG